MQAQTAEFTDWALIPLWPEQLETLLSAVRIAMANTYDFRAQQTRRDLLEYLESHRQRPNADPEAAEIERAGREVWLPAFRGAPTLAKVKKELYEYAGLLKAIAEDRESAG